jgi:hypothetical protein
VHHQHAHQWLQSPNSDESAYLDSQMISPGASYTLEMTFNGSGNRNKVVGDSIFHCHFYPALRGGMWAMWRTHDTFEEGSTLDQNGLPVLALARFRMVKSKPEPPTTRPRCRCRRCRWRRCRPQCSFQNGQNRYGTPGPGADPTART